MNAWTMSQGQHQARILRLKQPHACEISPYQYQRMSKRARSEYDKLRRSEWSASEKAYRTWLNEVIEAYDRGDFSLDHPDLHSDAKSILRSVLVDRKKEAERNAEVAEKASRMITDIASLKVGDKVVHLMYGPCTVTKVNRKSVRVTTATGGNLMVRDWLSWPK